MSVSSAVHSSLRRRLKWWLNTDSTFSFPYNHGNISPHNLACAAWDSYSFLVRISVCQSVCVKSIILIYSRSGLLLTSKVIITGLLRMWDTARELVFLWFFATCRENRSCGVGFIHPHAASWLIVHARVITVDCIAIPPFNFLTRPWTQQHQMRNSKFGLTSYVSVLCVTRNHLQPPELWWMVSLPPKNA